jgi:hypothetical protein
MKVHQNDKNITNTLSFCMLVKIWFLVASSSSNSIFSLNQPEK